MSDDTLDDDIESVEIDVGDNEIRFYTDGSCIPNPGDGGYGVFGIRPDGLRFYKYGFLADCTNNVAEAHALYETICLINTMSSDDWKYTMAIYADSKYVIGYFQNILTELSKTPAPSRSISFTSNIAIWNKIYDELEIAVVTNGIKFTIEWVKGHSGVLGNELADYYANNGRLLGRQCEVVSNSVLVFENKAENKVPQLHPFISGKRWFFFANTPGILSSGTSIYFSVSYIDDKGMNNKNAGKKSAQAHYAICLTNTPITVLDDIRSIFNTGGDKAPVLVNTTSLTSKKIWASILANGNKFLKYVNSTLSSICGTEIGRIVTPPKLIFNLENSFLLGLVILDKYTERNPTVKVFDITTLIFSKDKNKNVVSSDFKNNTALIETTIPDLNGKEVILKLNVGIDIPIRNKILALSKIKNAILSVEVVLYEVDDKSFRFITVIKCNDDIGIFYNPHSNYRLINAITGDKK